MVIMMNCRFKDENFEHYVCDEVTDLESGLCIFHDESYLKDTEKKEANEQNVQRKLTEKIENGISANKPLMFIKYHLPDFTFKRFIVPVNFSKTVFLGPVNFIDAQFTKEANFREARFTERADFARAEFTETSDFARAIFIKEAHFYGANFAERANFYGANFTKEA